MSTVKIVTLVCDLTLLETKDEVLATDTLRYFDPETGELRETDLSADNFSRVSTELAALTSFLRKISRPVEGKPKGRRHNKPAPVAGERSASVQEMRAWLTEAGWEVNPRGRLPKALEQAFLDGRHAPVQTTVEIPPESVVPVETAVAEVPEEPAMLAEVVEQADPPLFFPETQHERKRPEREVRGRKITQMTDEERRDLLVDRMLKAMGLLYKDHAEEGIPNLHSKPNDIILMLDLGMLDGKLGSLTVTERGVDALRHAGLV